MTNILLIVFIIVGFVLGRLSKRTILAKHKAFGKASSWGLNISITVLLFMMGYKIASSQEVLDGIATIGLHSLFFGIATLLGSSLVTFAIITLYRRFAHPDMHRKLNLTNSEMQQDGETHSRLHNILTIASYLLYVFIGGVVAYMGILSIESQLLEHLVDYLLFALVLFVGIDLGQSRMTIGSLLHIGRSVIICSIGVVVGSLLGALTIGLALGYDWLYSLAIGSGMGWYSISGVLLSKVDIGLGAMAFLSNLIRELTAMATVPIIGYLLCPESAVSACGATAMDTCLPAITKGLGREYILSGIACGIIVSTIVPFFLSIIQIIYGIM